MDRHRSLVWGSILRVVGLATMTLVAFFLMPFLVHSMGDRLYGYWALVGALMGYYGLLDLGIVSAVQFQVANALGRNDEDSANRAISTSVFAFAVLGVVAAVLILVLAVLAPMFVHDASDVWLLRKVLMVMGAGFAVGFPGRVFVGAISAHLRWELSAIVDIAVIIIRTALVIVVIKEGGGIISLALVTLACDACSYVSQIIILYKLQPGLRISPALANLVTLKELLRYGGWASITRVADQLRFYVDGWVVSVFVGITAVTHYAIASRLSISFMNLLIAILGMLAPWFSMLLGSRDYEGIRRVFAFSTKIAASVSAVVAGCLLLYGHAFIERWIGVNYVDAYWPLAILVTAVFSDVCQQPTVSYLYGVSKHGFLAKVTLIEGIINLGLSIYLGRRYGMIGVALGTLIPMLLAKLLVQPVYACRQVGQPIRKYYVETLGMPVAATAVGILVPWLLIFKHIVPTNVVTVMGLMACQGLIGIMVDGFFIFTPVERSRVLRTVFSFNKTRPIPAVEQGVN